MAANEIETLIEFDGEKGQNGILGIDNNNRLYWNGKPVLLEQAIKLERWVNIALIIASLSTAFIAFIAGIDFFCK